MKIEENQIWVNKTEPHRSIEITGVGIMFDETDEGMYCIWKVYDEKAWGKFVLKKKFKGMGTLDEHIKNGKNTFPYPFGGECSVKSMKQRIRKYKLELLELE